MARAPVTGWTDRVTEDPGGTDQIRAPRNRDPREAEKGPPVASRLDYLALQPTLSVSSASVAVHTIGQWTRRTPRPARH